MAPLSGSLAEKYEILTKLRQGGADAVSSGDRIPDAEELARGLAEVQARFPDSAAALESFFSPLLSVTGEAEPAEDLYLRAPAAASMPSRMDEVTWAKPNPDPLYDPPETPPAAEAGDSSSLLFRLALSTAALLLLFVFARGFWWPEPERRESAPAWAAAPRTVPPPPAAAEPPSQETEPTLREELMGEPAEPAASPSVPKPVIVEAAPAPVRRAPHPARPEPAASGTQPLAVPETAVSQTLARRVLPPWEEGPQPADVLKPGPGVEEPVPLDLPRFTYPPAARGTGLKADVRLALLVDERGRVIDARVRDGAPADLGFSEAALAAGKRISFQPATRYEVPGKMWTEVILEFVE